MTRRPRLSSRSWPFLPTSASVRGPRKLLGFRARELGGRRALAAGALIGGTVLGGLFGPLLLADALARACRGGLAAGGTLSDAEDVVTYILTLSGVQAMIIPALVAMRRREMKGAARAMALMPLYYALVCLASWAALFDLAVRPFHWAKTAHGRVRAAGLGASDVRPAASIAAARDCRLTRGLVFPG